METATDLELNILIDGYELVMSRVINLFNRKLTIYLNNVTFDFEFLRKKYRNASAEYVKSEDGETSAYDIKIFDSDTEIHGLLTPMEVGKVYDYNYYISLVGRHGSGNYRQVVFNLLRRSL